MSPLYDRAVYFNEIDAVACAVLRACHPGVVDERSIKEVSPDDVRGFERAHFFAGAGLWQVAADMAGWVGPLWTASVPCQPFSVAGKRKGFADERDLWPDFFRLVRECRPPVIVGEQVTAASRSASQGEFERAKDLQRVQDREDVVGVLQSLGDCGRDVLEMSGLSEPSTESRPTVFREGRTFEGKRAPVAHEGEDGKEGMVSCERGQGSGSNDGPLFRFGRLPGSNSRSGDRGPLRDDRDTLQNSDRVGPLMGQPVIGSDRPGTWIRNIECSSGAFLPQRDDEQLGGRETDRSGRSAESQAAQSGKKPDGSLGRESEAQIERDWLDRMHDDLEGEGYAVRTVSVAACSVDAPHRRQRLYWVAVADADCAGRQRVTKHAGVKSPSGGHDCGHFVDRLVIDGAALAMADADRRGRDRGPQDALGRAGRRDAAERPDGSFWSDAEWLACADGKTRRAPNAKSYFRDVADGFPAEIIGNDPASLLIPSIKGRAEAWKLTGNAIVPQIAAQVLAALAEDLNIGDAP